MLATAGVAGAASLWLVQRHQSANKRIPHLQRAKFLLTPQQQAFYAALSRVIGPRSVVFPRVNLSHLVEHPGDDPTYQIHWRRVCRRWLDFVICDPLSMSPVLAIKLESRPERKRRNLGGLDVLEDTLKSARVPLLRLPLADEYNPAEVVEKLKWVLIKEKQNTDNEPHEHEEGSERSLFSRLANKQLPNLFMNFAQQRLPTFSRWTSELRTVTIGFARAVARH